MAWCWCRLSRVGVVLVACCCCWWRIRQGRQRFALTASAWGLVVVVLVAAAWHYEHAGAKCVGVEGVDDWPAWVWFVVGVGHACGFDMIGAQVLCELGEAGEHWGAD